MKKRGFLIGLACALVLAIGLTGCRKPASPKSNTPAGVKMRVAVDYPVGYDSLAGLVAGAENAVRGEVLSSRLVTQALDTSGTQLPYTVYTVRLQDVYKGGAQPGGTMQVWQVGGGDCEVSDYVKLDTGGQYVFFTNSYGHLLNATQAVYTVEGDKLVSLPGNPIQIADLAQLEQLKEPK